MARSHRAEPKTRRNNALPNAKPLLWKRADTWAASVSPVDGPTGSMDCADAPETRSGGPDLEDRHSAARCDYVLVMARIDWTRDEIILACSLVSKNNWRGLDDRHPDIIELSRILQLAPIHPLDSRDVTFRNPNGVARKSWDIATAHPDYQGKQTRGNKLDGIVLQDFLARPAEMERIASSIRELISAGEAVAVPDELEDEDEGAFEGRLLLANHYKRERNRPLRQKKLDSVRRAGKLIACEVCEFDFEVAYGELGHDYIEVHHVLPLHASGPVQTKLRDLALLCANCHRMLHRARPWLTPDQLRAQMGT